MKYTNIKKLLIKFMGGGLINFPTRFLRWIKIDGDADGDDGGDGGDGGGGDEHTGQIELKFKIRNFFDENDNLIADTSRGYSLSDIFEEYSFAENLINKNIDDINYLLNEGFDSYYLASGGDNENARYGYAAYYEGSFSEFKQYINYISIESGKFTSRGQFPLISFAFFKTNDYTNYEINPHIIITKTNYSGSSLSTDAIKFAKNEQDGLYYIV